MPRRKLHPTIPTLMLDVLCSADTIRDTAQTRQQTHTRRPRMRCVPYDQLRTRQCARTTRGTLHGRGG